MVLMIIRNMFLALLLLRCEQCLSYALDNGHIGRPGLREAIALYLTGYNHPCLCHRRTYKMLKLRDAERLSLTAEAERHMDGLAKYKDSSEKLKATNRCTSNSTPRRHTNNMDIVFGGEEVVSRTTSWRFFRIIALQCLNVTSEAFGINVTSSNGMLPCEYHQKNGCDDMTYLAAFQAGISA